MANFRDGNLPDWSDNPSEPLVWDEDEGVEWDDTESPEADDKTMEERGARILMSLNEAMLDSFTDQVIALLVKPGEKIGRA